MLIVLLLYDISLCLARLRFAIQRQQFEGADAEKPRGPWARVCRWYVGLWIRGGGERALDWRIETVGRGFSGGGGGA